MIKKITKHNFITIFFLLCTPYSLFIAQIDSRNIPKPPINIKDSTLAVDSLKKSSISKDFFVSFNNKHIDKNLVTFTTTKKEVDRMDYKYTGNVLSYLPFSSITDLGHLGTPNEPNIYNFGYGNISLNLDNFLLINRWNGNSDLNRVQTEAIYNIGIAPVHRSFLSGNANNISAINILTNDSLQQKPISRFRYYQASNDEDFVDAYFSARVLPRLALSFRITNNSVDDNYSNSDFGSWKFNLKGIYKLMDSLYAKVEYNHLKINSSLNGGVDIEDLIANPLVTDNSIYNNQAPVNFEDQTNSTTFNLVSGSLYGDFIPTGYSEFRLSYNSNIDVYKRSITDSTNINNENKYTLLEGSFIHDVTINNFKSRFTLGYENIDYSIEGIEYYETQNNYFATGILNYDMFGGILKPGLFGKFSEYNSQDNKGLGFDLIINPTPYLSLWAGYSYYDQPYSIIEKSYIDQEINSDVNTFFASVELNLKFTTTSVSYFSVQSSNNPIPIFNAEDITLSSTKIIFRGTEDIKTSGMNVNSKVQMWNILFSNNLNYYLQDENSLLPQNAEFNLTSGLYYVDTLFNSNLDLKTGFTFHLFDNIDYRVYDFQQMRSSSYYLENNIIRPFQFYDVENDNYRLDFLLAGRIQDRATFYFIYENILGNNYYVIPYYPMPEGGIKIGISWDFLD